MNSRALAASCVLVLALFATAACGSSEGGRTAADERKLIEEAIDRHLAKRSDLDFSAMGVTVSRVHLIDDDKAEAAVRFQVGETAETAIQMTYSLVRAGETWEVAGAPRMGGQPDQVAPPARGELPANHPPVGDAEPQLPSGHPAVN